MTESEWLRSDDPYELFERRLLGLDENRRRADLFTVACAKTVLPLIQNQAILKSFQWLEDWPGSRVRASGGNSRDLFQPPGDELYRVHHQRIPTLEGSAVHVAYDYWAEWYEYAFENVVELYKDVPHAFVADPKAQLVAFIRDIFGNPFRPVEFSPEWRTSTVVSLAKTMYDSRDFGPMPLLADSLQDAGCEHEDILSHCRDASGTHVRGCWVVDLTLGKG